MLKPTKTGKKKNDTKKNRRIIKSGVCINKKKKTF